MIESNGMAYHQYADDTQLYIACKPYELKTLAQTISVCTNAVKLWFLQNDLLLNADKSETMLVGTRTQLKSCSDTECISVAGAALNIEDSIKILGVTLDRELSFKDHVHQIAKACNYHLWALRHIRKYLTTETANTIACSLVSSRLDYCNALLNGTSVANMKKLQRIQNNLARIVMDKPRRTPSHDLRRSLHWLPITSRLQYKTVLLTFEALHTGQPPYLAGLLTLHQPSRQTRSSSGNCLIQPVVKTQVASRGFRCQAPKAWNSLPVELRTTTQLDAFKSKLKTHCFKTAYDC